jgi:hypothetical protein
LSSALQAAKRARSRIAAYLFALVPLPSYAGPPFLTGDPDTVERGHWENSVGVERENRHGERLDRLPTFEVNYGVREGLEFSFESAWLRLREDGAPGRNGVDNSIIGLKWRLLEQEKDGVTFAVKPEFEWRNASSVRKGLTGDENVVLVDFRVQRNFGPIQLGASLAPVFPTKGTHGWEYGAFVKTETAAGHAFGIELHGGGSNGFEADELIANLGAQVKVGEAGKLLLGLGREVRNTREEKLDLRVYLGWQFGF